MVDVGGKPVTVRRAVAQAVVRMAPQTVQALRRGDTVKGDVLGTARVAGIMAAKQTPSLIPLCHSLQLTKVEIEIDVADDHVNVRSEVQTSDRTGVEMEAMTAASIAALTIYDMLKGVDRAITIEQVTLLEKHGGRSGSYVREP